MRDFNTFFVADEFCGDIELVRKSALDSGFGTWKPNKGDIGSSIYEGMNFWGLHHIMLRCLSRVLGGMPVFPNSMFFRVTKPDMERAYIHSDHASGNFTCVAYLSKHLFESTGTGFYRHRASGLLEMPSFQELQDEKHAQLKKDMVEGGEHEWELTDFVAGHFNRAVIFYAPLFHARHPLHGLGNGSDANARMVWVSHFCL